MTAPGGLPPLPAGAWPVDNPKKVPQNVDHALQALFPHNVRSCLIYYREQFYRWTGAHWEPLDTKTLESMIWHQFRDAVYVGNIPGSGNPPLQGWVDFDINPAKQREIVKGMQDETLVDREYVVPLWLDGAMPRPHPSWNDSIPPQNVIALQNVLLDTNTRLAYHHSPQYFNHFSTQYDYNPHAAPPYEWIAFLRSIWPEDQESIDCLQEVFGYLLTQRTDIHKMFMLYGAKRGGKGTIIRILSHLLGGDKNVASTSVAELATDFGLANLEKKSMAVMSDLRFRPGASDDGTAAQNLLRITGEDTVSVNRKFKDAYDTRLSCRFLIASNELPKIRDESGALQSRIILLKFTQSFLGREDRDLEDRIAHDMSGIFNWALDGLDRLNARGEFVQPKSGIEDLEVLQGLTSPTLAFISDCCMTGELNKVLKTDLYDVYRAWCDATGTYSTDSATFGKNIRAALPHVTERRSNRSESSTRARMFIGIGLNPDVEAAKTSSIASFLDSVSLN